MSGVRAVRVVLVGVAVLGAYLLQVSLANRLPLPGGPPQLLVVVVAAVALAGGPPAGMLTGFSAGLLADLAPPADHLAGRLALTFGVVGYLTGMLQGYAGRSVAVPLAAVAGASAGAQVLDAGLAALLGGGGQVWSALAARLPGAVAYDVVLAPFVVPVAAALSRREAPR